MIGQIRSVLAGLQARRYLCAGLVMVVIAYAILLRFDAISNQYDAVAQPQWLSRLQQWRQGGSVLRPSAMHWVRTPLFPHRDGPATQYRSDPYTYLERAREMRSFYGAHLREPLFPFAVKIFLWLLHDQDVAVSVAAAFFSVLSVVGTFVLGAMSFSYAVGLGAAVLLAVEYDVITFGTQGWRDDAFAAAVVWSAVALLAFMRHPSRGRAILFGVIAGAACLVRITSPSFLLPEWIWALAIARGKPRLYTARLMLAMAVAVVLVTPYLVNCWRTFHDPLYAIDFHAAVYQSLEDPQRDAHPSVVQYLTSDLRSRPLRTLDTFVLGMTTYPFTNKWNGFSVWGRGIGPILSLTSLAGLALFAASGAGRFLLIVLAGSLVPYAFTWRLVDDWRFTEHAYPFFLIASCSFIGAAIEAIRRPYDVRARVSHSQIAAVGAVLILAASVAFVVTRVMPRLLFAEQLRASASARIVAGDRDGTFFPADEWPRLIAAGETRTRVTSEKQASVFLPLERGPAYDLLVRIDPSSAPVSSADVPAIDLLWNGRSLSTCQSGSLPARIGVCRAHIPADAVLAGTNRLTFVSPNAPGLRVWYVRVEKR